MIAKSQNSGVLRRYSLIILSVSYFGKSRKKWASRSSMLPQKFTKRDIVKIIEQLDVLLPFNFLKFSFY
ncbi:MAG: hypothetical protein DRP32_06755 [Thermotogae bacterium]|nr:MAG: hypothetical protein DRP32_06755 [Thermotogota bacterium]